MAESVAGHPPPWTVRLDDVEARIAAACARAGRQRASVQLLAVSKAHPVGSIQALHGLGVRCFGENRAQELRDKLAALDRLDPPVQWHFIGPLQKNKIKYIVGKVAMFHALDGLALAEALSNRVARAGAPVLPVLVEVNLGQEPTKAGTPAADALSFCHRVTELPGLRLCGLMSIPPWSADAEQMRPWHTQLAALAALGRADGLPLHDLSMGMSDDFEVAIEAGATIVRIGTRLFGARPPHPSAPPPPSPRT